MISGIPCRHAARCIGFMRKQLEAFVHESYSTQKYRLAYEAIIHPTKDPKMWPNFPSPKLAPPHIIKKAGRPEDLRRRIR